MNEIEKTQPEGTEVIKITDTTPTTITLRDVEQGSRSYSLIVQLVADGAVCDVVGRAQAAGENEKAWSVQIQFLGKKQTGTLNLRGTAEDSATLQFDGGAELMPDSSQATADITERMMLFDQAKGKALPVLTVRTDDVAAAAHAASVAPIHPEKLLYLRSRGIFATDAKQMLKDGFLSL